MRVILAKEVILLFTCLKRRNVDEITSPTMHHSFRPPFRCGLDSRIEPMPFTPKDFAEGGILIDEIKKQARQYRVSLQLTTQV